jgi:predicted lactoylglutathione lyase
MATNIFVNLPVRDLDAAKAFFGRLGFTFNAQFTDETAAAMVISDTIYSMLLTHEKYAQFTAKAIADARATSEVLIALSRESRAEVDQLVDKALAAGATEPRPATDYGFMYSRSFDDLDGHTWEIVWMDPANVQAG